MEKILKHPYFLDFKLEIKEMEIKEERDENPFERIGEKFGISVADRSPEQEEYSPPKKAFHDISEHEFDEILKNLSEKKSESPLKAPHGKVQNPQSNYSPSEFNKF